jgi:hypothetical protein
MAEDRRAVSSLLPASYNKNKKKKKKKKKKASADARAANNEQEGTEFEAVCALGCASAMLEDTELNPRPEPPPGSEIEVLIERDYVTDPNRTRFCEDFPEQLRNKV